MAQFANAKDHVRLNEYRQLVWYVRDHSTSSQSYIVAADHDERRRPAIPHPRTLSITKKSNAAAPKPRRVNLLKELLRVAPDLTLGELGRLRAPVTVSDLLEEAPPPESMLFFAEQLRELRNDDMMEKVDAAVAARKAEKARASESNKVAEQTEASEPAITAAPSSTPAVNIVDNLAKESLPREAVANLA